MLSIPHMIVVFIVVLVVFGPQKLPELARSLGKLMAEFRKASTDFKTAFEEEMRDLERQALLAERKKVAEAAASHAAAEPNPLTSAAPAGRETPSTGFLTDAPTSEALRVSPVAESAQRSSEEPVEIRTETAAAAKPHDAPDGTP